MDLNKTKFLIVHGMSGSKDDHWYTWLKGKLEAEGHKVINETFPNNLKADRDDTLSFAIGLLNKNNIDSKDLIIITHSSGCAVGFRIAEKFEIKGLIIVSGLYSDLNYKEEIKSRLYEGGFDWDQIKSNTANQIVQFNSDEDPYIPYEHFIELSNHLNSKYIELTGRKHFGHPDDSPKKFLELFEEVHNLIV